jgi:nicotinate dehydrogenase subunit B
MIANTLPQSLVDNPLLSQWIAFEAPGRVRVGTGKVEIGQGIVTALTQIAAEELDLSPQQVHIVSGQTNVSPAEGFTSGSYSIAVGGASLRLVCAEVRSLFLDRAAETLGCPSQELSIAEGKFLRAGRETGRDYWSLAGQVALDRRASGTAPVKLPSTYRIVGRNLPRLDLPAKLAGAAFIHDLAPENVVHARVLRRPWRGARLVALDESAVRKAAQAPIEILREGDFVAFTADSEIAATRAAAAARALAHWDGGEPSPDDIGAPDWLKAQPSRDRTVETGLPGRANQVRVVEANYSRPARWRSSRTARSRCGRTARARRCCATGSRARSAFRRRR